MTATEKKGTATPASSKVSAAGVTPAAVAKTNPKAAAKSTVKKSTTVAKVSVKPIVMPNADKPGKVKKPKLVRDSFTIPKVEYTVLVDLKQRAGKLEAPTKKSELLRAGIKALAAMSDAGFLAALKIVPTIKTGRPSKD